MRFGNKHRHTKYMPSQVDAPVWFNICEDMSSIVAIDKEPIAVNIKSKMIADGLKNHFDFDPEFANKVQRRTS